MANMETRDLDSLKPDLKNPRRMNDHDGLSLDRSIDKFGDLGGMVYNVRLDRLVGGHMRMETVLARDPAAKVYITERLTEPDVTGTMAWGYVVYNKRRLTYREVDWDEVTHGEANIAANRISGEFDLTMLAEYDQWLLDNGSDLLATGQTQDEISSLLGGHVDQSPNDDDRTVLVSRFTKSQYSVVESALKIIKAEVNLQGEGNDDMDANAIYQICLAYLASKTN